MTMPGLTGAQLTKEILSIRPDVPIILATGFSENISRAKAEQLGVAKYLTKPLLKKQMASAIREILDH